MGTGRGLLKRVMAGIRDKHDLPFAVWCREAHLNEWKVRGALLGASKAEESIAGALKAIRAAGLTEGNS